MSTVFEDQTLQCKTTYTVYAWIYFWIVGTSQCIYRTSRVT